MTCERCGKQSSGSICSMFNTEQICFECKDIELAHPLYEHAMEVELAAVTMGDYNFPGIGLPLELGGSASIQQTNGNHHD